MYEFKVNEMYEFKVGDKVKYSGYFKAVGTIVVDADSSAPGVNFDEHIVNTYEHSIDEKTYPNFWWCNRIHLEPVKKSKTQPVEAMTHFSTGAVRDVATDKAKLDLLPWDMMFRLAKWYELGAKKYGRNNWRLGQKKSHTFASLMRHAIKYQLGQTDEDHLSAVIWNAFSLMNVDEYYKDNEDLNDL